MEKSGKKQRPRSNPAFSGMLRGEKELKKSEYFNKNCWLVGSLDYAPYNRCQYCDLKFRNCLFLHYQIISFILILFFFTLYFLIDGRIPEIAIISVFTLVIFYGYFFNKSTDKIIQSNFTERKAKEDFEELNEKLEEKVNQQVKKITDLLKTREELLAIKEDFLHIVSHQLRTPVSIFSGVLDDWKTGYVKKVSKKEKEEMENAAVVSAERLKNTVNDMLNALDIDKGMEFDFEEVDIIAAINEIISSLKPNYDKKGLYLKMEATKNLPKIQASPQFIKQALMNLVDNAGKYAKKGGTTIIVSQPDKNTINIAVKDTGMGLTKENKQKLFQTQFYRDSRAQDMVPDGSGLGLYIVKRIVDKHYGQIAIQSEGTDKGSVFTITLPVKQSKT